jgi:hypothetical protein
MKASPGTRRLYAAGSDSLTRCRTSHCRLWAMSQQSGWPNEAGDSQGDRFGAGKRRRRSQAGRPEHWRRRESRSLKVPAERLRTLLPAPGPVLAG